MHSDGGWKCPATSSGASQHPFLFPWSQSCASAALCKQIHLLLSLVISHPWRGDASSYTILQPFPRVPWQVEQNWATLQGGEMTIQTTQASEATQAVASLAEAAVAASQEMQQGATVTMALNRYLAKGAQLAQSWAWASPGFAFHWGRVHPVQSQGGFSCGAWFGSGTAPDYCAGQSQNFLPRLLLLGFFPPNLSEAAAAVVFRGFWLHSGWQDLRCSSTGPSRRTKYLCSALLSCLNSSCCS